MILSRCLLATALVTALAVPAGALQAPAQAAGAGSANLRHVAQLQYAQATGSNITNGGTDVEFATIAGRSYALAGSYKNGLQIVDITDPEAADIVGVYDCVIQQGDVQVFSRDTTDDLGNTVTKTYVGYTHDSGYTAGKSSTCYEEATALGFKPKTEHYGTFIVDVSDPIAPRTVSWAPFSKGSHNHTIDPSGRYIYNSNSDLITSTAPKIEITDITDLSSPKPLAGLTLQWIPTGLGSESHDITFSADGRRAYTAALSHTAILDTTNPAAPRIISTIVDPAINVHHQADPVTLTDRTTGLTKTFLVIEDEFAGASGTAQCPNGGVHVWDVTDETKPVKVGFWNITDAGPTTNNSTSKQGRCTAHVFDLHEKEGIMTISYYNGGVRVVDISGLIGVALGTAGVGMKELAWYRFPEGESWSAKTPQIEADGSFYLYSNDQARGLDVFHYTRSAAPSTNPGVWLSAAQAAVQLPRASGDRQLPFCLLRR